MALTQAEKQAKELEIKNKKFEVEAHNLSVSVEMEKIRKKYDYVGMKKEMNDYAHTREQEKVILGQELQMLEDELIAE